MCLSGIFFFFFYCTGIEPQNTIASAGKMAQKVKVIVSRTEFDPRGPHRQRRARTAVQLASASTGMPYLHTHVCTIHITQNSINHGALKVPFKRNEVLG